MPDADTARAPEHLVLYDGTCGFCNRTVQWILDADRVGRFHFAPLQGATAAAIRDRHPGLPTDLDSVLYVDRSSGDERVFVRSDAAFRIAERLGALPSWLGWTSHLPRWLTDLVYRAVARSRHRLSRALAPCPLPPPTARARFLP
jgi:predicted DCC family thiol-disulfide oxidoreductase YuxK